MLNNANKCLHVGSTIPVFMADFIDRNEGIKEKAILLGVWD